MKHNIKLNNFERFYFQKTFGSDLKRLKAFRKKVAWRQKYIDRGDTYQTHVFHVKGGKMLMIKLNKHKVDLYIDEIEKCHSYKN